MHLLLRWPDACPTTPCSVMICSRELLPVQHSRPIPKSLKIFPPVTTSPLNANIAGPVAIGNCCRGFLALTAASTPYPCSVVLKCSITYGVHYWRRQHYCCSGYVGSYLLQWRSLRP